MSSVTLHFENQADQRILQPGGRPTVTIRRFRVSVEQGGQLLSVSQFSDEASITPQAVRKMIAEGRLLAQKVGEQHVISRDELNRYLATQ